MRLIGLQYLTLGSPPVNETQLMDSARKLRPYASVVDDFKAYQQLRDAEDTPVRMPILRVINDNDAKWHENITPAEWVKSMEGIFSNGEVTVQLLNEPNGHTALQPLAEWIAEVIRTVPSHVTLVCANFGVGHPDPLRIIAGEFDEALKEISTTRHWLGLHEYFQTDPMTPPDLDNRIGRWRVFDKRIELLNKIADTPYPPLKIVLTEYGRDVGGGQGRGGDGWRNSSMGADAYANKLINAVQSVYMKRNPPIPVCVFSRGGGFDLGNDKGQAWESFDVDETIISRLAAANATLNAPTGMLPPTVPPVVWQPRKIKIAPAGAYFRKQANTTADHWIVLTGGSTIAVEYDASEDVVEIDGTWRHFRIYGNVGYIRSDAADFVSVTPAPDPVPTPTPGSTPVTFTIEDIRAIEASLAAISEQIGRIREQMALAEQRVKMPNAA